MARYTPESRDRVRDAIDFVELVSTRTELRRAGARSYEGLCPFHDERSPSFSVEPVEKVYYCFGCQASGDVFTFVQEMEGVDFKGALELLADRAGVELQLEREDPREAERRARRERLLELLTRTSAYYERYLWGSDEAAGTVGASDCPTSTFATAWRIQAPVAEREWISTRISSPSFSPRLSCVVSWVESPSGSICSTSTPTVTDWASKPRASHAAASAISPNPVPGMTGWPCTLWSSR